MKILKILDISHPYLLKQFPVKPLSIVAVTHIIYHLFIVPLLPWSVPISNTRILNHSMVESINELQHVQRHFTGRIPYIRHRSYPERLAIVDYEPLEVERVHFDLLVYYKTVNGLVAISKADDFKYSNPNSLFTCSGGSELVKPYASRIKSLTIFYSVIIGTLSLASFIPEFKRQLTLINLYLHLQDDFN